MDDIKRKRLINLVILIVTIVLVVSGIVFRVDVEIAMKIVENAWKYPEDSIWVEYATEYLIWSEHPSTYQRLKKLFWNCRNWQEWPGDPPDYTAIQAAYILGSYRGEDAFNVLDELVSADYVPERPPHCVLYVFDALVMKGPKGYELILKVALGELSRSSSLRDWAVQKLGESKDPQYIDELEEIGNEFSTLSYIPYLKKLVIEALESIGTQEALEAVERISP